MATLNELKKDLFNKESRLSEARRVQAERKKKKAALEAKLRAQKGDLLAKKARTKAHWLDAYAAHLPPKTDFITDVGPPSRPGDVDQRESEAALLDSLIAEEPTRDVATAEYRSLNGAPVVEQDDGSTFQSGLTFNDPAYDVDADVGPVTDVTDLDTGVVDEPSFSSRLAETTAAMGRIPPFPTVGFMDPRITAQRDKLQRRRNALRALYGKAPKEIAWSTGTGSSGDTSRRELYKMRVKQMTSAAYAMAMPETEADVLDLARETGLPLTQLLAIHKDARPDYAYEGAKIDAIMKGETLDAGIAADLSLEAALREDGTIDKAVLRQQKVRFIQQGGNLEAYEKELSTGLKMFAIESPEFVTYSLPWRWDAKYKSIMDDLSKEYGKKFTKAPEGGSLFGGREYYTTPPNQSNTTIRFNLKDYDDQALLAKLSALNLPGFAPYEEGTTRYVITDPTKQRTGVSYDPQNAAMQDYADWLAKRGVMSMPNEQATALALSNREAIRSEGYKVHVKKLTQANSVLEITDYLQNLPPNSLGAVASIKLSLDNFKALYGDVIDAWAGPVAPEQGNAALVEMNLDVVAELEDQLIRARSSGTDTDALQQAEDDLLKIKSRLKKDRADMASSPEALWDARIAARLMSSALATLVARLYSTNDRLLKDQYMTFKERTNLTGITISEEFAKATVRMIRRLATMRRNYAAKELAGYPQPSTWGIDEETGILRDKTKTQGAIVLDQLDALKKERGL